MLPAPEHRLAGKERLEAQCQTTSTAGDRQCPDLRGWVSILDVLVHQGESNYKLGMDSHQSCNKKSYTTVACFVSLGGRSVQLRVQGPGVCPHPPSTTRHFALPGTPLRGQAPPQPQRRHPERPLTFKAALSEEIAS